MTTIALAPDLSATRTGITAERTAPTTGTAWVAFLAGLLTPFTLPLVGEFPVGELLLLAAAGWAIVGALMNHAWPTDLLQRPLLGWFLASQALALVAYIASDLYRHSSTVDLARGWGRMAMLAIDILAVAFLFGRSRRNLALIVMGTAIGQVVSTLVLGALFDDAWKFGFGAPITFAVFLVAPRLGPMFTAVCAGVLGVVHFEMDYRSLGALCVAAGVLNLVQLAGPRWRLWIVPLLLGLAAIEAPAVYEATATAQRATRSDIERSAMVTAALEAVADSPFVGHGSWFSNSDVYDRFMRLRLAKAREAHVGGFADPNKETDAMALHSQILVALAEGGIVGGAFFVVFGGALLWALCDLVFACPWSRETPFFTLLLLLALWNLFFSPFSGAHRIYLATACGLLLLLRHDADDRPAPPSPVRPITAPAIA